MPSRKQRRRREKLQRHEYEYVIETEEGEEITVERLAEREKAGTGKGGKSGKQVVDRRGRPIPKPSLQRVAKRTAIFGPIILVLVFVTSGKDVTTANKIFNALLLLVLFIPFSYLVDVFMYRAFQRRQAKQGGGTARR
jgi:hypothetical protein